MNENEIGSERMEKYKFDVLGDGEEDTMYACSGHDVPLSAFVAFNDSEYEDTLLRDKPMLKEPRNVFAVWVTPEIPSEEGQQNFVECDKGREGAEAYTVCDLEWAS